MQAQIFKSEQSKALAANVAAHRVLGYILYLEGTPKMVWVISSSWGSVDLQSRMYDQVVDPSSGALPLPANEGLLASSTPNAETMHTLETLAAVKRSLL